MNILKKIGQEKPKKLPPSQTDHFDQIKIPPIVRPHTFRLEDYSKRGNYLELSLFDPLSKQTINCFVE